jgi:hypothetical protein
MCLNIGSVYLNIGSMCLNIGSMCINIGSVYINIGSMCLNIGSMCLNIGSVYINIGSMCWNIGIYMFKIIILCNQNEYYTPPGSMGGAKYQTSRSATWRLLWNQFPLVIGYYTISAYWYVRHIKHGYISGCVWLTQINEGSYYSDVQNYRNAGSGFTKQKIGLRISISKFAWRILEKAWITNNSQVIDVGTDFNLTCLWT